MRRYKIVLTGNTASAPGITYDSQVNGQDNLTALDITFDVTVGPLSISLSSSYVEIFGISLQDVAKVNQWQGGTLSLYGGFSPGFPLAKANQFGLLASGEILQAFGNWTGTHQSIIFFLTSAGANNTITFSWRKGQTLSSAIIAAIKGGYASLVTKSFLKNDPVAVNDDLHFCPDIYTLAGYIKKITNDLGLAPATGGVNIFCKDGLTVGIYDSAVSNSPTKLDFNDFQGQPIYFGLGVSSVVQTTLNLRADLTFSGKFTFPIQAATGYLLNQPAAAIPLPKDNSALTGTFTINSLRHVGRFRDPQGQSWVTIIEGFPS